MPNRFENPMFTQRSAGFSPDRKYRYWLLIVWDPALPVAAFIGLNPSTADEVENDPTITRCCGFAENWGCGGILMLNIFAFRATDPKVMKAHSDPVGPENDLAELLERATGPRVACWGTHALHQGRGKAVRQILSGHNLQCFGRNRDGTPKHPLYLRSTTKLEPL